MKKTVLILFTALCGMTLYSFVDSDSTPPVESYAELLSNDNYNLVNIDFSPDHEQLLDDLSNPPLESMAAGFFVRCDHKDRHKFTHGTIAGSGCCTSGVQGTLSSDDQQRVNDARIQIDALMQAYL